MSAAEALLAVQPAAGCCASERVLSTGQPIRARYLTCSRLYRAYGRRRGPMIRCIQHGHGSCGAAHSSLRYLRPLASLTRRYLARVTGPLGTSTRSIGSRRGQPYDVVMLIAQTGYYGACGRDTARYPHRGRVRPRAVACLPLCVAHSAAGLSAACACTDACMCTFPAGLSCPRYASGEVHARVVQKPV
eukprot:1312130-Prymnesium_polylepis.1